MKTIETASKEQTYNFVHNNVDYSHPNFVANEKKQSFEDGVEFAQRWIPIEEKLPETYNCQILVKKGNENFCDLRFFHHEEQFKLLCSIHKYTHWRPIY